MMKHLPRMVAEAVKNLARAISYWSPSLGTTFLLPASARIYCAFHLNVLLPQAIQVFLVALAFSLALVVGNVWISKERNMYAGIVSITVHSIAILLAYLKLEIFRKVNLVVILVSLGAFVAIAGDLMDYIAPAALLQLSINFLLLVVTTIYFQGSLFLSAFVWVSLSLVFETWFVVIISEGHEVSAEYEQVCVYQHMYVCVYECTVLNAFMYPFDKQYRTLMKWYAERNNFLCIGNKSLV